MQDVELTYRRMGGSRRSYRKTDGSTDREMDEVIRLPAGNGKATQRTDQWTHILSSCPTTDRLMDESISAI